MFSLNNFRGRAIITSVFPAKPAGLKPPSQYLETLRVDIHKSVLADFHVLRQDFSPTGTDRSDSKSGSYFYTGPYDKRSQTRGKIVLILESVNRHLSIKNRSGGYTVLDDNATIEHIMPQTLSPEWKTHLGKNWEQIYKDYLDTLGNLTLVTQEWNSGLSNSPYANKKIRLADHALKLNGEYFSKPISSWDDKAIQKRTDYLLDNILEIWEELGTPPVKQKSTGTKPRSLTIIGQSFVVNSWRDVAYYTAQVVAEFVDDFELTIASQLQSYFDQHQYQSACRQLPNGWWMYLNLSAMNVKSLCHNLIALAGIPEDEWQLEEE
ncbi:MAG: HNH endonuclease family protein [Chloroflexota bacterium]